MIISMFGPMLRPLGFGLALAAPVLGAEPRFAPIPNLPEHVYAGGWSHFVGGGVAAFDCNGDGLADLFMAGGTNPASLMVNASEKGGEIRFKAHSVPPMLGVTGAYPLDVDGDGLGDLMVLRNGRNLLLKGDGQCGFRDMGTAFGLPEQAGWTTAFAATWKEGQMLPTLAIGNYVDATNPEGPFGTCDTNWLLRPDGMRYGAPIPLDPGFCPLSMLFSDWRRDGAPMLRISNDRQYYVRDGYEQMWHLDPLRELTSEDGWAPLKIWGMGIASRDLDRDGLPEVMLTSMGDQVLMTNTGDGFAAVPYATGSTAHRPFAGDDGRPSTGWHAAFADIDNDGLSDLFIAKGNVDQMPGLAMRDPNNLLMQTPDGRFVEKADVAGVASMARSRGAAVLDLNADGLLDIVVVNRRAPAEIWRNETVGAGNWLSVALRQPGGNTHAVGAFLELRTATGIETRELTVGGGHVSGQMGPEHFGLGAASVADLRVTWPDGTRTPWQRLKANTRHLINRDGAGR